MAPTQTLQHKNVRWKAFPVFMAFLAMGFVDAVGPFVSLAQREFQLSATIASLIPLIGLGMFGLLSIPAGILQQHRGKQFSLLLGLAILLAGMLNACFALASFAQFLATIVLIGIGAAVLQVSGNPLMRDVSAEGMYARNLSLAQFVKAIGSISGPLIPAIAARYWGASWKIIFPVYSGVLVLIILIACIWRTDSTIHNTEAATLRSCFQLLKNRYVLAMTSAIGCYVGAEVCISTGIPLLLKERFDVDIARIGLLGTGLFFAVLTLGRLCGSVLLNWITPTRFLQDTCVVSIIGLCALFLAAKKIVIASFVLTGLGFANIFPLIFSSAVARMPERSNEISALMVTAIVGGAVLPQLMGIVADHSSVRTSMLIPLFSLMYVAKVALRRERGAEGRPNASS